MAQLDGAPVSYVRTLDTANNSLIRFDPYYAETPESIEKRFFAGSGLGFIPRMAPANRGIYTGTFGPNPPIWDPVICLAQVIPWPFPSDGAGVPYDQQNLVGVRTLQYRRYDYDSEIYGEVIDIGLLAVPKVLPPEYTPAGRRHIPPLVEDHLNLYTFNYSSPPYNPDNPDNFSFMRIRTADKVGLHSDDLARQRWIPQAMVEPPGIRVVGNGDELNPFHTQFQPAVTDVISPSCGFRSASLFNNNVFLADTVTVKVRKFGTSDAWTTLGTTSVPPNSTVQIAHSLLSPWFGYSCEFDFISELEETFNDRFGSARLWSASPRTDIPLWFFASTGNLVAPGGILP